VSNLQSIEQDDWVIAFNSPLSEKISHRSLDRMQMKKATSSLIEEVRARIRPRDGSSGRSDLVLTRPANDWFLAASANSQRTATQLRY